MSENELLTSEKNEEPQKPNRKMVMVIIGVALGFMALIALNMN